MEHQETIWIKKEETDVLPDEPGLVFLEDPLKTEVPGLSVKPDPELKSSMDCSEANVVNDPLGIPWTNSFIKEERGLSLEADETENIVVNDSLGISWTNSFIKEEPGLNLEADETVNIVVASTRCASNSTRLIQNSGGNCGISLEETPTLVLPNELKISAEESSSTMTDIQTQRLVEKGGEEEIRVTRLKCSRSENEFHKFRCSFCLQSFSSKYSLTTHVFIHMDGLQPPRYVCKSCGEVFPSDISLNKHSKSSEGDKASSAAHMELFDRIYKHENLFLEGGREFSVIEDTEQQSSSPPKSQAFPVTGTSNFKCEICGKSFTLINTLKRHTLTHNGERPHKCNVCGKSFTQPGSLNVHFRIHTGERPHKCNDCGKTFTQICNLKRHSLIHTGERPHQCNVCEESFNSLRNLRKHTLIHTGNRPFKCSVCGKSFTQVGSLQAHFRIHTGERPHKCHVCGKSFTQLCNLKRHVLIHTGHRPHKCTVCGKSFIQLGSLKRHSETHK